MCASARESHITNLVLHLRRVQDNAGLRLLDLLGEGLTSGAQLLGALGRRRLKLAHVAFGAGILLLQLGNMHRKRLHALVHAPL